MLNASSLPRFKCFTICSNTPRPSKTQISGSAHKRAPVLLCPGLGCSLHKAPPRASPPVGDVRGDTTAWWAAVGTCLGGEGHKDSPMVRGWGLREGREPPPGHRGTAPGGLTRPDLSSALSPPRGCAIAPWALWLGARLQKKRRERTKHPPLPWLSVTMGTPPLRGPIRDDSTSPRAGGCVSAMARGRGAHARISTAQGMDEGCTRAGRPQRNTPGLAELWFVAESFPPAPPVHWEVGRTWDPAPTSPRPSAPQFSSANQTEFTWEPQPRVRGGDRRYFLSPCHGDPSQARHTAGSSKQGKQESRSWAQGDLQPCGSQRRDKGWRC